MAGFFKSLMDMLDDTAPAAPSSVGMVASAMWSMYEKHTLLLFSKIIVLERELKEQKEHNQKLQAIVDSFASDI